MESPAGVDWPGLAGACGYYDQSHLIHEFRLFADETPEAFHFSNTAPRQDGIM
jgi:AraC-like DNA-binding protein